MPQKQNTHSQSTYAHSSHNTHTYIRTYMKTYVELAKKDLVKVYDFDSSSFHLLSALSLPLPSCPPPTLQCMYVDLYLLHTTFPPTCPTPSLLPAPPLPSYLPHPFPPTCPTPSLLPAPPLSSYLPSTSTLQRLWWRRHCTTGEHSRARGVEGKGKKWSRR